MLYITFWKLLDMFEQTVYVVTVQLVNVVKSVGRAIRKPF